MISRGIGHMVARRDCDGDPGAPDEARPVEISSDGYVTSYVWKVVRLIRRGLVIAAGRTQARHPEVEQIR